jgi:acetyl/propionyl-CoA carboxylase alpha subunit
MTTIRRVLVANRGEIACRVIRTLRAMGIASVAIHHAIEARARHVRDADAAFEIVGETPIAAHLDIAQIVATALRAGADAVHPGYGFLSENPAFARAVVAAGLVFIGPDADSIALMGDKVSARRFAQDHGVPVAPSALPTDDVDRFVAEAAALGFPLLIKAAAGGGGKGMSVVRSAAGLQEAARIASSEALRYFGDGRVYAEIHVEHARHIEVQVLGDGRGGALHLFERECSVQRRFQKIIEEAPAARLDPALRERICAAAVTLTGAARYRNAGTVEFIVGADDRFYFLEMNTRLQVEHPVTELITGLDLVQLQIEIARTGTLPFGQAAVRVSGHAVECRICAEDPARDFLPETGAVARLDVPQAPWLRFESALETGTVVTADFDPMLAKLVVHGSDRAQAIQRGVAALDALAILGVKTNSDYLARVLSHPAFGAGALDTGFVARHAADLAAAPLAPSRLAAILAAAALAHREFIEAVEAVPEPHASIGHWRN